MVGISALMHGTTAMHRMEASVWGGDSGLFDSARAMGVSQNLAGWENPGRMVWSRGESLSDGGFVML